MYFLKILMAYYLYSSNYNRLVTVNPYLTNVENRVSS